MINITKLQIELKSANMDYTYTMIQALTQNGAIGLVSPPAGPGGVALEGAGLVSPPAGPGGVALEGAGLVSPSAWSRRRCLRGSSRQFGTELSIEV